MIDPLLVKKSLAALMLPPGIFVVLLAGSGWWCWRGSRRRYAAVNLLLAGLIWLLSTAPVANGLMAGLEQGLTIPSPLQGDVIILLGGGIHEEVPDLTGQGSPTADMMARIVTAVRAQRQLKVPIIVSGGALVKGREAEAPVIRRFLLDLGVPQQQIIVEDQSRDTMENARFCRVLTQRHGFTAPLLVTSAYHMRRSLRAFEKNRVAVRPLPAQFVASNPRHPIWLDYLPTAAPFNASATALREYLGLLFYRLSS